jgi:hypothetical protein
VVCPRGQIVQAPCPPRETASSDWPTLQRSPAKTIFGFSSTGHPAKGSLGCDDSYLETTLARLLKGLVAHLSEDGLELFHVGLVKFVVLSKEQISELALRLIVAETSTSALPLEVLRRVIFRGSA